MEPPSGRTFLLLKGCLMDLYIKNMVCNRCIKVVKDEFEKAGLEIKAITLGKVSIDAKSTHLTKQDISDILTLNGFELLEDKKAKTVETIKNEIIKLIYNDKLEYLNVNLSQYLKKKLAKDYSYLSTLFSQVENITLEHYVILQKIERVKELIVYDELTLSEISYQLGYSSLQHLSNQFKKITGLTPSHFKKIGAEKRKPLDQVKL